MSDPSSFSINTTNDHTLSPMMTMDIGSQVAQELDHVAGISKAAFSPFHTGVFVCGTENLSQPPNQSNNRIIIGSIDGNSPLSLFPVQEDMRDLDWLDPRRLVVALDSKLGIVEFDDHEGIKKPVLFPDFHKNTIRQISVNTSNNHLVLSGGFDGNVFVTNITRLVDDIQKNEQNSENSVYMCGDVVGSVSWHPRDHNVASCTTDPGWLHVFDIRTDQSKPAFVYDTNKLELFAHTYIDDFTVALGYGDGQIQIHDIRNGREVATFQDPHVRGVGDTVHAPDQGMLCVLGQGGVSVYHRSAPDSLSMVGHTLSSSSSVEKKEEKEEETSTTHNDGYKTAGQLVPGSSCLAVTGSDGVLSLYEMSGGN